jgi:hypothetical protein
MEQAALADLPALLRLATAAAIEVPSLRELADDPPDPPIDSACALDLVQALVARSPRVLAVTLAGDRQSYEAMAEMIETTSEPTQLDRVRTSLFSPQASESGATDDSLDYFSAPGEGGECVEIARRIRNLTDANVPFDRIAILLRDPERYQPFLEEALRRAGWRRTSAAASCVRIRRARISGAGLRSRGMFGHPFRRVSSLGQVPSPDTAIDDEGFSAGR